MRIVIHAGIDGWQEISGRELPQRGRLEDARARDIELGVLDVRQFKAVVRSIGLDFGLEDRGRRNRRRSDPSSVRCGWRPDQAAASGISRSIGRVV